MTKDPWVNHELKAVERTKPLLKSASSGSNTKRRHCSYPMDASFAVSITFGLSDKLGRRKPPS